MVLDVGEDFGVHGTFDDRVFRPQAILDFTVRTYAEKEQNQNLNQLLFQDGIGKRYEILEVTYLLSSLGE